MSHPETNSESTPQTFPAAASAKLRPLMGAMRSFFGRTLSGGATSMRGSGVPWLESEGGSAPSTDLEPDSTLDPTGAIDAGIDRAASAKGILPLDTVTGGSGVPLVRRAERKSAALPCTISEAGIALIKRFEGCAQLRRDGMIEAYPDPGTGDEPWTIGWGTTGKGLKRGEVIGPDTVWTQKQCDQRLAKDLKRYARDVAKALGAAPRTQGQFDALVSFHYNTGAIARATLTKRHLAGEYEAAAREFKRWNKAGGSVLKGLVRRRAAEEELYRGEA